jgi:hypothetical protein
MATFKKIQMRPAGTAPLVPSGPLTPPPPTYRYKYWYRVTFRDGAIRDILAAKSWTDATRQAFENRGPAQRLTELSHIDRYVSPKLGEDPFVMVHMRRTFYARGAKHRQRRTRRGLAL